MFGDFDDDFFKDRKPFDDPFFKEFHERHQSISHSVRVMDVLAPALSVLALVVLLALCCACCRRTRYSGRVLAPGDVGVGHGGVVTATTTYVQAPYPQQPYSAPVVSYPVGQSAPYPTAAPYPTHQWGGGMPLPTMSPVPAPTAPASDERAPAAAAPAPGWAMRALPPSYEQVVAGEGAKQSPYNPNYPH